MVNKSGRGHNNKEKITRKSSFITIGNKKSAYIDNLISYILCFMICKSCKEYKVRVLFACLLVLACTMMDFLSNAACNVHILPVLV